MDVKGLFGNHSVFQAPAFSTRRSAEHSTPHADVARLAYLIEFRMIKFRMIKLYLLPGKVWKR